MCLPTRAVPAYMSLCVQHRNENTTARGLWKLTNASESKIAVCSAKTPKRSGKTNRSGCEWQALEANNKQMRDMTSLSHTIHKQRDQCGECDRGAWNVKRLEMEKLMELKLVTKLKMIIEIDKYTLSRRVIYFAK